MPPISSIGMDSFNNLVSDIYDAALDHSRWPKVLERITQALNVHSGLIRSQDLRSKKVGMYVTQGLTPEFQQHYKNYYIHLDTLVPAVAKQQTGSIHQTTTLLPESFFKGEFYNDYAHPQGIRHTMGCVLTRNNSQLAVLGLHRPKHRGYFKADEIAVLELLVPHLQRAIEVNRRLLQLARETHATHVALHRLMIGVILVDTSGKPLFLNKQAEAIIADGIGLMISKDVLRAHTWSDTQTLHKLIHEAAQAPRKNGGSMAIANHRLPQPLSILVTPVGKEQSPVFQLNNSQVAAALFIGSAGQQLEVSLDALSQLYGLTRAEARLAAALADGRSMEAIAERFDVSPHTLRSQLKACFRKTGTHRQTELVKLVLCAPAIMLDIPDNG